MQSNNSNENQNKPKPNTATIIILIVLLVLIIFGVGGYFTWKYISNIFKNTKNLTEETVQKEIHSQKINILENVLSYPNCVEFDKETNTDTGSKINMKMVTSDDVKTVYLYYEELILGNNWVDNGRGLGTDLSGGYFRIEEKDFQADINIKQQNEKTSIEISIYFENDDINFSHVKPDISINNTSNIKKPNDEIIKDIKKNEYIFDDSNSRIISKSELYNLSPWELKVARNEIYARHGREFVHKDLACYFASQSWYSIDPNYKEGKLNSTEQKNVATILAYEKEIDSSYLNEDSGCNQQ